MTIKKLKKTIFISAAVVGLLWTAAACNSQATATVSNDDKSKEHTEKDVESKQVKPNESESTLTKAKGFDSKPPVGTKAFCPIMQNEFTVNENTQMSEYNGKTYAFCCPGCKPQFDENPSKYI